ncbi:Pkr1-domain-containing protein [Aaosphaeria arxii CBS 175.79]|uniref:Pkr1-domain-containing protein n=1 Tax=Aaosphaeria arxii CBS 175.79 TaxID=1450172 RepID=A0A6A5XEK8_9PLEO|nr:Pkr1-domain-containing protein [Aaosphaeria arxii CBS 175.79]KAF2011655.1 Pkr1-domain-containing protein [Aaosphaeria arxii CBS 175.79]
MASFMERLWESIFEPGPTPTLLVATNATFAALQLLLFTLLIATYSVHFVILSILCGGLWWAINWFAREIRAAQEKEEEAKRIREARREKDRGGKGAGGEVGGGMDSGDDTETEVEEKYQGRPKATKARSTRSQQQSSQSQRAPRPETQSTVFVEKPREGAAAEASNGGRDSTPVQTSSGPVGASTSGATTRLAPLVDDAVRKRNLAESTGELSTDSEWEKLSQDSGDR